MTDIKTNFAVYKDIWTDVTRMLLKTNPAKQFVFISRIPKMRAILQLLLALILFAVKILLIIIPSPDYLTTDNHHRYPKIIIIKGLSSWTYSLQHSYDIPCVVEGAYLFITLTVYFRHGLQLKERFSFSLP